MDHNGSDDEVNAPFGNDEEMGEIPQVEVLLLKGTEVKQYVSWPVVMVVK